MNDFVMVSDEMIPTAHNEFQRFLKLEARAVTLGGITFANSIGMYADLWAGKDTSPTFCAQKMHELTLYYQNWNCYCFEYSHGQVMFFAKNETDLLSKLSGKIDILYQDFGNMF